MEPVSRLKWLEQVAEDGDLPPSSVRVAIVLQNYVNNKTGDAWPSQALLCERLTTRRGPMSRKGLQVAIGALVDAGHLAVEICKGRGATNRYRPVLKSTSDRKLQVRENANARTHKIDEKKANARSHQTADKMRTPVRGGAYLRTRGCVRTYAGVRTHVRTEPIEGTYLKNLSNEPTEKDSVSVEVVDELLGEDTDSQFETFWQAYPRKAAKAAARKAYATAITKIAPDTLLRAAMAYGGATANIEPRYIKHPANWLNAEGWLDDNPRSDQGQTLDAEGNVISANFQNRGRPNRSEEIDRMVENICEQGGSVI
ncbi:hypothetical protein PSQ90_14965 [Devosia rhodophyticola]|uniref:Helix-turn-helix domain-containing protein n=1 Tax=Devosia rhodophyticola TaxID=3026423 RepID=A0ABY7YW18_9HYPH|nr:hypothetical protein [Devosia rhodophyticola]WDR05558.1 hypothetical protein PSQ90_14965 [Devosia rhodophyticola]